MIWLFGEIWTWMILAFAVGLATGWWIWRR
jgi:hypothetical protein